MEDLRNVEMASSHAWRFRLESSQSVSGSLERAAENLAATGRQALELPPQKMETELDKMNIKLKNMMDSLLVSTHAMSEKAKKELEDDHGKGSLHKQQQAGFQSRPRGGGNDDESQTEFSTVRTETTSPGLTEAGYMTMIRMRNALNTLLSMLQSYEDFKANTDGELQDVVLIRLIVS